MRLFIYTIYDSASAAYMRPFFMQSDGAALRAFTDIASDAEHEIGKHPEDYSLWRIGDYDDQKAKVVGESPENLATAMEVVASSRRVVPDDERQFFNGVGEAADIL